MTPTRPDAVAALISRDPDLAAVVARLGAPPVWSRPPGFATLCLIILEQQVSLASARAAFDRTVAAAGGPLTPDRLLAFGDDELRAFGWSRQKRRYGRALAGAVAAGSLDLDALGAASDEAVRRRLTALPGIGPWTADIYLLAALDRPDVWPAGDLALATAAQEVTRLPARPDPEALARLGDAWRPFRSTAARILWHHYLAGRGRVAGERPLET